MLKQLFLNCDLEEEIYIDQPEGSVIHGKEYKVCKWDKSLYGMKQAPKQWHEIFDNFIILNGYKVNERDKCIYHKFENVICIIICLYVNGLIIFGSNLHVVNDVKSLFYNKLDMKDLREGSVILGIKINISEQGIPLHLSHYMENILKKYNYFDCKPACTLYGSNVKNTVDSVRKNEYGSIIGSL